MPPTPEPNKQQAFVKLVKMTAILEAVVLIAAYFIAKMIYGNPLDFEKTWPIWIGGLAPIYLILTFGAMQLGKQDNQDDK